MAFWYCSEKLFALLPVIRSESDLAGRKSLAEVFLYNLTVQNDQVNKKLLGVFYSQFVEKKFVTKMGF